MRLRLIRAWPIRPWDRLREDPGDPWDAFAAWKRWMDEQDGRQIESFEPFIDELGSLELADLYGRFRSVADGDETPYLVRLCSVLSEPLAKAWWWWRRFYPEVVWDTRWYLRHWRAGHRPRHDGMGHYVVDYTDADGRPHHAARGMWWDRIWPRRGILMARYREARRAEADAR